jgi:heme/copper-type cytochrome/quinol oxidase subunit 4
MIQNIIGISMIVVLFGVIAFWSIKEGDMKETVAVFLFVAFSVGYVWLATYLIAAY